MKDYKSKILKIFIPIMLSNVISQIQMLIDRIFLGRMDVLFMSAVGNATAPVWTTLSFVFSLSMGASILISQKVGSKEVEAGKEFAASLVKYHNVIPILLFLFWTFASPFVYKMMGVGENVLELCVSYTRIYAPVFLITGIGAAYSVVFQTSNYTKPLVTYGILRSLLNIILDYVLIFGKFGFPRMEIRGAALGTTIAEFVGAFYLFYVVIAKKDKFFTSPSWNQIVKAKFSKYAKSIKLGVNSALEDFLWNISNLFIIRILNTIDEKAAGIYTMVFSIEVIFVVVIGALGSSTMTVSGEATGAKNLPLYRKVVGTAMLWSSILSAAALIISCIIPKQILSIFTTDKEVIEMSVIFVILVQFNLFGKSGNIVIGSGIRGYGDTRWMLITQTIGTVMVVAVAALFVFVFKWGLLGVFLAVILDEALRAIANSIRFLRIKF